MKEIGFILTFYALVAKSFGQDVAYTVYEPGDFHCLATNLKNIDTISLWNYQLDSPYVSSFKDSVKPVGHIHFWRVKPVSTGLNLHHQEQMPHIDFEIFGIGDSTFCYHNSMRLIYLSSCVPPAVGGDVFTIGKFIFLNRNVCVSCGPYGADKNDYCRPIINLIFGRLTINERSSLSEIVRQFPIKAGN